MLTVETVDAFMLTPQPEQNMNPPVTVMQAGFNDLADTQAQGAVIGRHRAVTELSAADLQLKTELQVAVPFHAAVPASGVFCQRVLQHSLVRTQIGHPFLQPQVFLFQLTHVLQF